MAADKTLTSKKYQDIRLDYDKWLEKKFKGVQIYTDDYIYLQLSEKFYLAPRTIENIVYHRVSLVDKAQLTMF